VYNLPDAAYCVFGCGVLDMLHRTQDNTRTTSLMVSDCQVRGLLREALAFWGGK